NIAHAVIPHAFSWYDYPHTYNQWPISRILRERPRDLLNHAVKVARDTLGTKLSLAGAGVGIVAIVLTRESRQRRLIAFCLWLFVLYVLVIIVPTHYTDRAYAPVAMLASVLVSCGLAALCQRVPGRWALAAAAAAVGAGLLLARPPEDFWHRLQARRGARHWNERVVHALEANGMRSSDEVFTNMWAFYPLDDPRFVTFYNYGGWIELDSVYARERPHPTATSVKEWQDFFRAHDIHFAVLQRRSETKSVFNHTPPDWKRIFSDKKVTAWALPTPEKPAPEAAAAPAAP
ncbi:MAG TPA: hypothetical protein VG963_05020, partial [Polyangiaceae bacterium]|nr:hypothetical protein [Polyangiaceae bacterium]